MEFKKERVYSAVNADELKPGDKVLTSNNIASLKEAVRLNVKPSVIVSIWGEMYDKRFQCKSRDTIYDAELAYLVERVENCTNCEVNCWVNNPEIHWCKGYKPKTEQKAEKHTDYNHCEEARKAYACAMTNVCPNKHYRPFRDTDELVKVWDAKIGTPKWGTDGDLTMPHIWVRNKVQKDSVALIVSFDNEGVVIARQYADWITLFNCLEFLDGSPCGVEE